MLPGILCLALLAGCGRPSSSLTAKEWSTFQLPPAGPTLPTPRSVTTGNHDELAVLDTAGRVTIYSPDGALLRQWPMLDVSVGTASHDSRQPGKFHVFGNPAHWTGFTA